MARTSEAWVELDSNYEYVLGQAEGKLLRFTHDFQSGSWTFSELEHIAAELKGAAQEFATQQGLGGTKLYDQIEARVEGQKIKFENNVRDEYERYYAGHVEFGHHDRKGNFIPARPFMRPAMMAVREASLGHVRSAIENMWNQIFFEESYLGYMNYGTGNRAFYNKMWPGEYTSFRQYGLSSRQMENRNRDWKPMFSARRGSNDENTLYNKQAMGWG